MVNHLVRIAALVTVILSGCADSVGTVDRASPEPVAETSRTLALVLTEGAEVPLARLLAAVGARSSDVFDVAVEGEGVVAVGSVEEDRYLRAIGEAGSEAVVALSHRATTHQLLVTVASELDLSSIVGDLSEVEGSTLVQDTDFALLDEGVLQQLQGGFQIPENMSEDPNDRGTEKGLCFESIFSALGAGQVKWKFRNPAAAGYSVDDEDPPSRLAWARDGVQDVDAIYRHSWGCTKALKIPDSCIGYVESNGSISCCCNGILYLVGTRFRCQYINPSRDDYFADCPL